MDRLALLHGRLTLTVVVLLLALLVWGLLAAARGGTGQGYRAGLWIAALLVVAQGALGALLLGRATGTLALHVVYGVVAVGILPAALWYCHGRTSRWDALILAAACLLLLAVVARAFVTAH